MGWQDRDWAKWTDEERSRFVGHRSVSAGQGAFVAVAVSLVLTVVLAGGGGLGFLRHRLPPVYGTGTVVQRLDGRMGTCTELLYGRCAGVTALQPGQRVLPAASPPRGTTCPLLLVDQSTGAWYCGPTPETENS